MDGSRSRELLGSVCLGLRASLDLTPFVLAF